MTSEEAALRDERGPVGSDRGAFGRFMTEAEASPDVLGVILMGSRGFDHFVTPRSDHDALVIVAKDPFPWQRDHGSAVETWPMTIGQFRTHGLTVDVWNRAAFLDVRVILDRLDGEILRLVEEKRTLRPDEAEALGANRVDGYINSLVRSLRNLEAGREVEGRLDAIESIGPLLEAVFAFEGRVRPFNKWLRYETAERPLAFGDIVGLVDQIATCPTADIQRAVFRQFEVAARTGPDPNSNRVAIVVSAPSARLFKALAEHFGTEAIELRIDDSMFGAEPGSGRQHDTPPFWGGASIQSAACSDGFPWTAGVTGNAILTAAHCFSGGGSAKIGDYTGAGSVLSGSEENWDPVHGTQFYSGQTTYRGDVALIRLTGS